MSPPKRIDLTPEQLDALLKRVEAGSLQDGDYEILIGRDLHNFVYFRNDGDSTSPSWTINNGLFSGIGGSTYWNNPSLADLDNDGDLDLTYGTTDGRLFFYENIGTTASPNYQFNFLEIIIKICNLSFRG